MIIITLKFPSPLVRCHHRLSPVIALMLMWCECDEWTRSMQAACRSVLTVMMKQTCTCNFLGRGAVCDWGILHSAPLSEGIDWLTEGLSGSHTQMIKVRRLQLYRSASRWHFYLYFVLRCRMDEGGIDPWPGLFNLRFGWYWLIGFDSGVEKWSVKRSIDCVALSVSPW